MESIKQNIYIKKDLPKLKKKKVYKYEMSEINLGEKENPFP